MHCKSRMISLLVLMLFLTGCGTTDYEFNDRNAAGAVLGGAGGALLASGSSSGGVIALSGFAGAAIGYYVTTLRFKSRGVLQSGGQVFTQGDFVAIVIPSDYLFDPNSTDLLDSAGPMLDSAVEVLMRYPNDDILISGNTSGFSSEKYELKLSEARARMVADYLSAHGINDYQNYDTKDGLNSYMNPRTMRKLTYTGYGNYFPIANDLHNASIRQNSRIQITAYPKSLKRFENTTRYKAFHNIGKLDSCEAPERPANFGHSSQVLREKSGSRRSDFKGVLSEGATKNPVVGIIPPAKTDYKDTGSYNSVSSASQTVDGGRVEKHGGFKGETNFKDESPR